MNLKLIEFIENSFLKELLERETITDISFNGEKLFYQDNLSGRLQSDLLVSNDEVYAFLRQIANLTDQQFSITNPILDVSVGRYRISALHSSLARKNRDRVYNFSIRIGYDKLRISDDGSFINKRAINHGSNKTTKDTIKINIE